MQISGKYAEVAIGACEWQEMESWDLTFGSNVHEVNTRSGGGYTTTVDGVHSGRGSLSGFIDPDDSLASASITTGTLVTLTLRHTITGPVVATGQARLGQFSYSAARSGEPQPVSIEFVTHGEWTFPGQS